MNDEFEEAKYKKIIEQRKTLLEIFQAIALNFTKMRKIMEARDKTNERHKREINDSDRGLSQCIDNVCRRLDSMEYYLFRKIRKDDGD